MQAWEVGVSLLLTSNIEKEIIAIGRSFLGLHITIKDVEKTLDNLGPKASKVARSFIDLGKTIGGALAVHGVGVGLLTALDRISEKAVKLNREFTRLSVMNIPQGQQDEVLASARNTVRNVRGVTSGDATQVYGQMIGMFPHDQALKMMEPGSRYAKVSGGLSDKPGGFEDSMDNFRRIVKAGEMMGRVMDPKTHQLSVEKLEHWLDMVQQMKTISHGAINEHEIDTFAQRSGASTLSLTDQGLREALAMIPIQGGHGTGTAMQSFFQQFQVGRMSKSSAAAMQHLGILKPGAMMDGGGSQAFTDPSIHGGISGVRHTRGGLSGARNKYKSQLVDLGDDAFTDPNLGKALRESPLDAIKALMASFEKAGIKDLSEQLKALGQITSRGTVFRMLADTWTNLYGIQRDVAMGRSSQTNREADKTLDARDFGQAQKNLSKAWEELYQTIAGPKSTAFLTFLHGMTTAIRKLDEVLKSFKPETLDTITTSIAVFGATLAAAGGIRLAIGIGGWLIGGFASLTGLMALGGTIALALGPTGWIAAGIMAIGAAAYAFPDQTKGVIDWFKSIGPSINTFLSDLNASFMKWQSDNLPSGSVNDVLNTINKHFVEWQQKVMAVWEAWKTAAIAKIIEWKDMAIAALGEAWTAIKEATLAKIQGWWMVAKGALNTFVGDIITDIKSWPERLKEAITEFGTKFTDMLKDAFKGVLKGLSNPAGPGANPYSNSSYQGGGGYGGLTHLASLGGGGYGGGLDGNGNWSDIGQGVGANDNRTSAIGRALRDGPAGRAIRSASGSALGRTGSQGGSWKNRSASYLGDLADGVRETANRLGISAEDLATMMSYETAGTLDSWKKGPHTKWGTHRGLIQWGEPQAKKYGVGPNTPVKQQMEAVGRYLRDHGVKPGMHGANVYAAINAGNARNIGARDAAAGGAPGTVMDKWLHQMGGHRVNARHLLEHYGSSATAKSHVPPARQSDQSKPQSINLHVDGRKMAGVVTRHQSEFANGPSHGGQGFDRTRTFAGNDSGFRTAV